MENQTNCKECQFASSTVFKSLTEENFALLDNEKKSNTYKKNTILYKEGSRLNGIYCINKGVVKIYKTGNYGKEQIVAFAKSGDIIAYRSVLSNEPACTTAEVIEESDICFIPGTTLFTILKNNSTFALSILQLTCKELDIANKFIKDIAQKNVRVRLAEVLLKLDDNFGLDAEGFIKVTLTREDLSNVVGTATESVIRLLSDFKNEKLIFLSGKKIKLLEKKQLQKISSLD